MGKLGKNARKFAKKNLQSVLRDRRKKKALLKKRYSSRTEQRNVEDQTNSTYHSNERNAEAEALEDLPLDAPFMGYDSDAVADSSDSDEYLSEDISYENETDSEPGKLLEGPLSDLKGDRCTSELMMQNIKIQKTLAVQKRKMERLKRKLSDEAETSNRGRDSVTEDNQSEKKGRVLTVSAISSWCQLIKEEKEAAFVCLLNAYRAACNYSAESTGLRFQNAETFCSIVVSVLSEADNILLRLLRLSSSSYKKEAILKLKDTPQWVNVKPLIKSYLRSTLSLLDQVTDSEILAFALTRLGVSLSFFAAFPYLLKRLIKTAIHLWATGGGMLSSVSFSIVRDVASLSTANCFDNCLAKAFVAYLSQSRATEVNNKHLQFLGNSLVALCSLDVKKSMSKAMVSVRQLVKLLQMGLRTKKKEALQRICSWEYANCINIWVGFIAGNIGDYDLQDLFFTLVQLINGVVHLFPGPRYFPLRLHCIQWLNDLSNSTGVFIPVASFVLDVLEYKIVGEGGKPGPTLFFQSVLKLPKNCLRSLAFQDECITSAIEQLSSHFSQWSYHISFPELATVPLIRLKKFCESRTKGCLYRAVKDLIEQVEKNVDSVQKKRDDVAFSPNDHQSVEAFLQFEKSSLTSPFSQYYRSVLEKAALRGSHENVKISFPRRDESKRKREQPFKDAEDESLINGSGHKDVDTVDGTKKRVKRRALNS
ncbi:unnamed protein product [Withania somnifera]